MSFRITRKLRTSFLLPLITVTPAVTPAYPKSRYPAAVSVYGITTCRVNDPVHELAAVAVVLVHS